ncbi:RNA polymerase sigma factor [Micromonospora marina]|uniref:RNA polymerase sigma-70 factor, ECF subfamily n=1 Tax=Micromonospora marina TaxID=307120 RepID=A0A1C4UC96_9ACTN|nr:RNA polymerase sigma factor [Micromonospora marina]SCE69284.1 RNA polymerase sigma-70 factor, ECF subfamily [Micromonospora marina]
MDDDDNFTEDLRQIAKDPAVFRAYYKAHVSAVQNYLARRVADAERVADLTADVFLAAISAAPSYRAAKGTPLGWTYGIARNVLLTDLRRTERERRAVNRVAGGRLLSDDDIARLEERIDAQASLRQMMPAIDELPEGERAVLELVAVDGLTIRDAAAALRITAVAARVRLHRARRHLNNSADKANDVTTYPLLEALQ